MRHLSILLLCAPAVAQSTTHQIALNYNYNGIVHLGEDGDPDNPDGYRSIGDRGLNFTGGAPSNPTIDKYNLVTNAGALDIVHLGCRPCTGWNGYDGSANGDCRGTVPNWLIGDEDQSGPQTTTISPMVVGAESRLEMVYHISDGGGRFKITCNFESGNSANAWLGGNDWWNGPYAGTGNFDCGSLNDWGLHIDEGTMDLRAHAGEVLSSITFHDPENGMAGYAIFAANMVGMDAAVVCAPNAFCFGDGSGADCPCLNFGGP